jgi:hypothetical protein
VVKENVRNRWILVAGMGGMAFGTIRSRRRSSTDWKC